MQINMTFTQDPSTQHTLSVQKVVGQGKFQVYQAKVATLSDTDLALKVFTKTASASLHYAREKQFLSKVSHPNIISYIPILQHNLPHYILATEYTPNGDFFDFVTEYQATVNNEKLMRTYFRQLIDGLEYLHGQGIAHLDLKLENILLDKDFNLRILDFDQAQFAQDNELRSGGTEGYRAPEMLTRKFKGLKTLDIYSAGILLYTFFSGQMPFVENKNAKVCRSATYPMFRDENEKFWREKAKVIRKEFSEELKELLNGMWDVNPEKRMRVEDIKRSKWYNGEVYTKEELKREVSRIFGKINPQ